MRPIVFGALGILAASVGQAQEPGPLRYRFDAARSVLKWELPATLHTVRGVAPRFEGFVQADPLPEGRFDVRARIAVNAAAMNTGNPKRDRTLREKVLETERHPEIVFELKGFTGPLSRMRPDEIFTAQVEGTLTIHGHTEPVLLPVDVHVLEDHVLVTGTFPVHWKKYGLADPSFGLVRVKEPLHVVFRLRAVPEKPR
jgi:polyisoprenoid-binding protein YceI